jgi:hypothetical protein
MSILETHILMSSLICRLVLILMFCLARTLVLCLTLFHILCLTLLLVLCLSSFMDLTIAHMVLVHERTALSLDALVLAHVLVVVIVSRVGLVFLLEGPSPTLSRDTWTVHVFPIVVHVPLDQVVRYNVKTSSGRMVKCWIPKIYLTNPSTEPSTLSHPM